MSPKPSAKFLEWKAALPTPPGRRSSRLKTPPYRFRRHSHEKPWKQPPRKPSTKRTRTKRTKRTRTKRTRTRTERSAR